MQMIANVMVNMAVDNLKHDFQSFSVAPDYWEGQNTALAIQAHCFYWND